MRCDRRENYPVKVNQFEIFFIFFPLNVIFFFPSLFFFSLFRLIIICFLKERRIIIIVIANILWNIQI